LRKKIAGFLIGLALLGIAAMVFFYYFEITDDIKFIRPSREAMANQYLALDRWLASQGYKIRIENSGTAESLRDAAEGIIYIQTDLVKWNDELIKILNSKTYNGTHFILSLDSYWDLDDENPLVLYLKSFGIESGYDPENNYYNTSYDENSPVYGRNVFFNEPENAILILRDAGDYIRLVEFENGMGKITVSGRARFMTSSNLGNDANARLSWHLFSGADPRSVLFIRGVTRAEGIFGRIFRRGNFYIVIFSAIFLICIGFWTAIPVFGNVKDGEIRKGKMLSERFLAEGNFLKRYNALDVYRSAYFREIKRKLILNESRSGMNVKIPDDEIIKRAASVLAESPEISAGFSDAITALQKANPGKNDFKKSVIILKTILESL